MAACSSMSPTMAISMAPLARRGARMGLSSAKVRLVSPSSLSEPKRVSPEAS
jgi:hypothetical protein